MKYLPLSLISISVVALLSSCCSTEKFEQRLNTYINKPKIDVVQDFGPPIATQKFGNSELVTFMRDRTYFSSGTSASVRETSKKKKDGKYERTTYIDPGTPPHYVYKTCQITFRFTNGKAVSWSHSGNDCCD